MSGADLHATIAELSEQLRARRYGKYRGIVTDVDATTMRVRAQVPVLGDADLGWATACVPYAGPDVGFVMLPEIGSGVWIEFEGGDISYPIWVGGYWRDGEVPADAATDAKAIFTASGVMAIDDAATSLRFEDKNGNKLVVDGSGVLAQGSAGKVAVGATVSVNDGALEVS